jgi:hypothetical protein
MGLREKFCYKENDPSLFINGFTCAQEGEEGYIAPHPYRFGIGLLCMGLCVLLRKSLLVLLGLALLVR